MLYEVITGILFESVGQHLDGDIGILVLGFDLEQILGLEDHAHAPLAELFEQHESLL